MTYTPTEFDNPALGLFFGLSTEGNTPVTSSGALLLPLMFSPGEFSVNDRKHEHFVTRISRYGKTNKVVAIGGTEAADDAGNNTHDALLAIAPKYGFHVIADPHGTWLLIARWFGNISAHSFTPIIPAQSGPATAGGHNARGILSVEVQPTNSRYGQITFGVSHYLTHGQTPNSARGKDNVRLMNAIKEWGDQVGSGNNLVFHMADTNRNTKNINPYPSNSFTTCWDELKKWPGTEGNSTLDVVSSLNKDGRVKCVRAFALHDSALPLPVDHAAVVADYQVTPIKEGKTA